MLRLLILSGSALVLSFLIMVCSSGLAAAQTPTSGCETLRTLGEVAIIGHTDALTGTVTIPELDLTATIVNSCFGFRNLMFPEDAILVTFVVTAEGFRPTTFEHYLIFGGSSGGPDLFLPLERGTEPEIIDPCPYLIANPQEQSAVIQEHAKLCAEALPNAGTGPGDLDHGHSQLAFELAMLALAVLGVGVASSALLMRRR